VVSTVASSHCKWRKSFWKGTDFKFWRAHDLDLDIGSGHTAYCRASLVDLYLHAKFHWQTFETGFIRSTLSKSRPNKCKEWQSICDGRKTHKALEWNSRRRQPRRRSSIGNVPVSMRGSVSNSPMIHRPSDVDGSQQLCVSYNNKMVKTGQFTTKCNGNKIIALKLQKSLWWDSA